MKLERRSSKEKIEWEEQRVQGASLERPKVKGAAKEDRLPKEIRRTGRMWRHQSNWNFQEGLMVVSNAAEILVR